MNNKTKGITYIGAEMALSGEMTIHAPASIAGKVQGVIRSSDQVKIELGGEIDGEVYCQELRVSGTLKGKLFCNKLVIVSSGVVEADVSSHDMEIYDGGQFIGMRTKGPDASVLPAASAALIAKEHQQVARVSTTSGVEQSAQAARNAKVQSSSVATQPPSNNAKGTANKMIYAVAGVAVAVGVIWQSGVLSDTSSAKVSSSEPALFSQERQFEPTPSVTEKNAAKLLKDVQDEHYLLEQQEELTNAGLADVDTAMEDLHSMEASHELLAETDIVSEAIAEPSDEATVSQTNNLD
ncbi:polymer-forming cytoskeletal protein [Shewanella aestuarii]|uniref:Polymer-forming cytoskeletal protein n=1 Tax=Shewanella aestuarii TaxID=1028752 RepID=A0A6G9QGR7_9GAMM|nr:polymer-forming cytoskeletal protein [Shewanella aestuarii]QIR13662.1 polymer-forming cytoskeletal protein [Shewanella aestuarii]